MNIDKYFINISLLGMYGFPLSAINANLNSHSVTKNQTPTLTLLFNLRGRLSCLICGVVHLLVPFETWDKISQELVPFLLGGRRTLTAHRALAS